jgi:hypothetical protein
LARRAWLSLLVPAVATGAGLAWGCGPGVQAIYEGNVRFEHCYRLDLDPHVAPTHREACWREWTQLYTYGQNRDRVDYAERRIRALESGDYRRPILDLQSKERPEIAPAQAPIPTSLNAPPPAVLTYQAPDGGAPDAAAAPEDEGPKPPATECVAACGKDWNGCNGTCGSGPEPAPDAGATARHAAREAQAEAKKKCEECSENYRHCMERCFK